MTFFPGNVKFLHYLLFFSLMSPHIKLLHHDLRRLAQRMQFEISPYKRKEIYQQMVNKVLESKDVLKISDYIGVKERPQSVFVPAEQL